MLLSGGGFIWGWLWTVFLKAVLQDSHTSTALDSDNALSAGAPCRNVSNFAILSLSLILAAG